MDLVNVVNLILLVRRSGCIWSMSHEPVNLQVLFPRLEIPQGESCDATCERLLNDFRDHF